MIVRNKDMLNGKWRIDGTRISVETIIIALKSNGIDWILENYPTIAIKYVEDCLNFYINDKEEIINEVGE